MDKNGIVKLFLAVEWNALAVENLRIDLDNIFAYLLTLGGRGSSLRIVRHLLEASLTAFIPGHESVDCAKCSGPSWKTRGASPKFA